MMTSTSGNWDSDVLFSIWLSIWHRFHHGFTKLSMLLQAMWRCQLVVDDVQRNTWSLRCIRLCLRSRSWQTVHDIWNEGCQALIEFHCWHHEDRTSRYSLDLVWAGCLRLDVIYRSLISMRWIKQIGHPWQMAFSCGGDESSWVVAAEWHLGVIAEMRS